MTSGHLKLVQCLVYHNVCFIIHTRARVYVCVYNFVISENAVLFYLWIRLILMYNPSIEEDSEFALAVHFNEQLGDIELTRIIEHVVYSFIRTRFKKPTNFISCRLQYDFNPEIFFVYYQTYSMACYCVKCIAYVIQFQLFTINFVIT